MFQTSQAAVRPASRPLVRDVAGCRPHGRPGRSKAGRRDHTRVQIRTSTFLSRPPTSMFFESELDSNQIHGKLRTPHPTRIRSGFTRIRSGLFGLI
jgi:hypothetical protein